MRPEGSKAGKLALRDWWGGGTFGGMAGRAILRVLFVLRRSQVWEQHAEWRAQQVQRPGDGKWLTPVEEEEVGSGAGDK